MSNPTRITVSSAKTGGNRQERLAHPGGGNRQERRAHLQRHPHLAIATTEVKSIHIEDDALPVVPDAGWKPNHSDADPATPGDDPATATSEGLDNWALPAHEESQITAEHLVSLDLYGRDPVVFNRAFVEICGGVKPAIWLSYAIQLHKRLSPICDGWFHFDAAHAHELTGLTTKEYETARQKVTQRGFAQSRRTGSQGRGGRLLFKLDLEAIFSALRERSVEDWTQSGGSTPPKKAALRTA